MPQLRDYRTLPAAVVEAAAEAYNRLPYADQYADLLREYYAGSFKEDHDHKPYLRPTGPKFFKELENVISEHAKRWAKQTGWVPINHKKSAPVMDIEHRMSLLSLAAEKAAELGYMNCMVSCIKELNKMSNAYKQDNSDKYGTRELFHTFLVSQTSREPDVKI